MPFAIRVVQEFIYPGDEIGAAEQYMKALGERMVNEAELINARACMARVTADEAEELRANAKDTTPPARRV